MTEGLSWDCRPSAAFYRLAERQYDRDIVDSCAANAAIRGLCHGPSRRRAGTCGPKRIAGRLRGWWWKDRSQVRLVFHVERASRTRPLDGKAHGRPVPRQKRLRRHRRAVGERKGLGVRILKDFDAPVAGTDPTACAGVADRSWTPMTQPSPSAKATPATELLLRMIEDGQHDGVKRLAQIMAGRSASISAFRDPRSIRFLRAAELHGDRPSAV